MSDFQIIYALGLAVAIWWGGPDWRLSLACVVNFVGTMALAASPDSVGVLDLATIVVFLIIGPWRGYALAGVFMALIPIYAVGHFFGWSDYTTYAIVDVASIAILGVLASGDGGYRNKRRNHGYFARSGRACFPNTLASRCDPNGSIVSRFQMPKQEIGDSQVGQGQAWPVTQR